MKLYERISKFLWVLYPISALMVYGGVVNLGAFGIFPAIPFLILVIWITYLKPQTYMGLSICLFVVCFPLLILKNQRHKLYFPSIGKEVSTLANSCFFPKEKFLMELLQGSNTCGEGAELVPTGTVFLIQKIEVSNADMGENFYIKTQYKEQEITLFSSQILAWETGKIVEKHDLVQPLFYYPSLLMYWPVFPIFFTK